MEKRRVVITGLGTVNSLGNNVSASWDAAMAGKCGIGPITQFDASEFKCKLAGEVKNFDPDRRRQKEARKMARFTLLALAAATEAIADSGLTPKRKPARSASSFPAASAVCPPSKSSTPAARKKGWRRSALTSSPCPSRTWRSADRHPLRAEGMCTCPVTACAGGTNAVGDAFHRIRDGYEPVMVCGGAESCISRWASAASPA